MRICARDAGTTMTMTTMTTMTTAGGLPACWTVPGICTGRVRCYWKPTAVFHPGECSRSSCSAAACLTASLIAASPQLDCRSSPFSCPATCASLSLSANCGEARTSSRPPTFGPNHVFSGEPYYHGGPYGEPHNAQAFSEDPFSKPDEAPPAIAVLDTGYDPAVHQLHQGLAWRLLYTPADQETAVRPSGYLAPEGGHGTFIDGIIMRLAPQVRIRQVKVLNPAGVGDDSTVAVGLAHAGAPVVNLSLGGYTHDDMPPVALSTALARNPDVVAVAAAGNNDQSRPFWPAAFEQVVAVGALDTRDVAAAQGGIQQLWIMGRCLHAGRANQEHIPEGPLETAAGPDGTTH